MQLNSTKHILLWIAIYIAIILMFAIIYWGMYCYNTSSFYISEQYNERVNDMSQQHDMNRVYVVPDRNEIPFTIHDFNQKLKPVSDSLLWCFQYREELKNQYKEIESNLGICSRIFAESREKKIEQYLENALKGLKDSISLMEEEIVWIENYKEMNALLISSKYRELALLKKKLAQKILMVSNMVLENYDSFGNKLMGDTILLLSHGLIEITIEAQKNEQEIHRIFDRHVQLTRSFHQNRKEKVSFFDFFYFSTLVATSNSFGDILPNTDCTRGLVTIQLLLGIVYLACILAWIEERFVK